MRPSVRALAETLFDLSEGHDPDRERRLVWLLGEVDDMLRHAGPRARTLFLGSLAAIEGLAPLLARRPPPFHHLPRPARLESLEALERSGPPALTLFAVKALLSIVWFEHPRTAAESGFDGRCQDGSERLP